MNDVASTGIAADELRQIVERIERFDAEIADLNAGKKDVYAEARGRGFEVKIIKQVIALRRKDAAERQEHEAVLELYLQALGMA
ncbi:DUF2312 domain-containing protein [Camelimonas abortus]|uniref:DUF2312 domain-containing protein n=1 Tax=Camelimonas abortus TaxID=1017184 RepID=A0ABV7LHX7_9HYPH